jgi:hypothetical protein
MGCGIWVCSHGLGCLGLQCVVVVGLRFAMCGSCGFTMCDGRWCVFVMCDGLYYGGLRGMVDSLYC